MICPLLHNEPDGSFGEVELEENLAFRICPRCGLVFVPRDSAASVSDPINQQSKTKQILKWP